jgi:hypothetical protein
MKFFGLIVGAEKRDKQSSIYLGCTQSDVVLKVLLLGNPRVAKRARRAKRAGLLHQ